jgi:sulfur carrier protein ThiS
MRRASSTEAFVEISRFGQPTKRVNIVDDETTVSEALEDAGIRLASNETLWVNGDEDEVSTDDILNSGDVISIVGKKEGVIK